MRYSDGQEARLGDKVKLSDGSEGVVVCSIDTDEFTSDYPRDQWEYLKRGVMVNFQRLGVVHYEQADEDLELVERSAS
ncbi:hypothetical protein [Roseateles sp. MS654]|uniref:hypothetical protein n=1 Tax=Roseateles sp. MS654 TaxID=3412685 RepID=UPI003C2CC6F4